MKRIAVIDSHTGGEPTRIVISGGPSLEANTLAGMVIELREKHDEFRTGVVCEPRGHEAIVGGMLTPPITEGATAGIIFFNNSDYLGMCGHGSIGLVKTLQYMDRIQPGQIKIDTPVGLITAMLHEDGQVTIGNIPSYRYKKSVTVDVPAYGPVTGDIAYGGNWFFLTPAEDRILDFDHIGELTTWTSAIRHALDDQGITGEDGQLIDHIEVNGPGQDGGSGRNFVLCPGLAYDRSPCGTGTSAKLACLAADGKLQPGETWIQESVINSKFSAEFTWAEDGRIHPSITGTASITGESTLLFQDDDPFYRGII